jgi:hypothetical protein
MHDYEFSQETLSFYFNQQAEYPDEIDLVVVHDEYNAAVCGANMPVRKKMPLWTFSNSGVNRSKKSRSISVLLP